MPTKNCQCWHHWTLPSEEGNELLRSDTSSRSTPTSTATTSWPKPIATWLGHLILCILWTWRWTLPTGSSVGTQWTSYIQQDCEMEPVLQLTFSPTRLSGQGNRCMSSLRKWRWILQAGTSVENSGCAIFFNFYPCWITHQLTKINATLPYILIFLKFKILKFQHFKILISGWLTWFFWE